MAGTIASTQAEDMLARDRNGMPVSPTEPGYEAIAVIIEHAKQVCAELNAGYHRRNAPMSFSRSWWAIPLTPRSG